MPSSKEVRARQNRQKERVAALRAERQPPAQRRRRVGAAVIVLLIVIAVILAITVPGKNNSSPKVAVSPTTVGTDDRRADDGRDADDGRGRFRQGQAVRRAEGSAAEGLARDAPRARARRRRSWRPRI